MADHYIYKPNSEAVIKTIGSEEQGWRFYFVLTKISPTPTNTPSSTFGSTPTGTPTNTPTPTITKTQTPTQTKTPTQTPTRTPNSTPGITPSNTGTPPPTPTNTPTGTPVGVTPTPSSTQNLACGTQMIINGPFSCFSAVQELCYQQNSLNNVTVYVNSSNPPLITEDTPVFVDSSCSTLISNDGFYAINVYYQNGSPTSTEPQVVYIKDGYLTDYLGGCSQLAYMACYVCNPSLGCSQKPESITLGETLLYQTNCDYIYNICGTYILYYCECDGSSGDLCCGAGHFPSEENPKIYFSIFSACQEACTGE